MVQQHVPSCMAIPHQPCFRGKVMSNYSPSNDEVPCKPAARHATVLWLGVAESNAPHCVGPPDSRISVRLRTRTVRPYLALSYAAPICPPSAWERFFDHHCCLYLNTLSTFIPLCSEGKNKDYNPWIQTAVARGAAGRVNLALRGNKINNHGASKSHTAEFYTRVTADRSPIWLWVVFPMSADSDSP